MSEEKRAKVGIYLPLDEEFSSHQSHDIWSGNSGMLGCTYSTEQNNVKRPYILRTMRFHIAINWAEFLVRPRPLARLGTCNNRWALFPRWLCNARYLHLFTVTLKRKYAMFALTAEIIIARWIFGTYMRLYESLLEPFHGPGAVIVKYRVFSPRYPLEASKKAINKALEKWITGMKEVIPTAKTSLGIEGSMSVFVKFLGVLFLPGHERWY